MAPANLPQVPLGDSGLQSSVMGLGCMGMSEFYGPRADDADSLRTLERAFDLGITLYDTSDMYGRGHNEELLGRFIKGRRGKVMISTKFGFKRDPNAGEGSTADRELDNSPVHIRRACEESLRRLGTDYIDLYSAHRYEASRPIEEVTGTLTDLVKAGKIRAIGYSEITAEQLRRACAVHPVAALQSEYSLWHRRAAENVLPTCREFDVAFVAYSPLGRGFLTGAVTSADQLAANDVRRTVERFQGDNLASNLRLVERVKVMADAHGVTPGQIALAWLLHQGTDIVPIPGTKRIKYLEENVAAARVQLSSGELAEIAAIFDSQSVAGGMETASQAAARVASRSGEA